MDRREENPARLGCWEWPGQQPGPSRGTVLPFASNSHPSPTPHRANPCLGLSAFLPVRLSQPLLDICLHQSHGRCSAPERGRGQEDHSAWGRGGAPQLHHWISSEWGRPQTREGPSRAALHSPGPQGIAGRFRLCQNTAGRRFLELSVPKRPGSSKWVACHWAVLILCKLNCSIGWGKGLGNFLEPQMCEKKGPSGVTVSGYTPLVGFPGGRAAVSVVSGQGLIYGRTCRPTELARVARVLWEGMGSSSLGECRLGGGGQAAWGTRLGVGEQTSRTALRVRDSGVALLGLRRSV